MYIVSVFRDTSRMNGGSRIQTPDATRRGTDHRRKKRRSNAGVRAETPSASPTSSQPLDKDEFHPGSKDYACTEYVIDLLQALAQCLFCRQKASTSR